MVAPKTVCEVSVKVVLVGKIGYNPPQGFLAVCIENVVYKLYQHFGYLIIKYDGGVFKCYVHSQLGFMTCAIADAGRIKHHAVILALISFRWLAIVFSMRS